MKPQVDITPGGEGMSERVVWKRRPWWKHVITTIAFLTSPIWIIPFMAVFLVVVLWTIADETIWGKK